MAFSDYLVDDEEIYRRTLGTANEYGEKADIWNLVTTIKGTIQPKSGNIRREELGDLITATHKLYCALGSDVKVGDRVKDKNTKWYNVLFVSNSANRNHHLEVSLRLDE